MGGAERGARVSRCDVGGRAPAPTVLAVAALLAPVLAAPAHAVFLDGARNVALRARLYTEASIATEGSEPQTITKIHTGDVVSHRTFFNPELDANLTRGLSLFNLDEIKFRMALWGFYDGIYDYLDPKWRRQALNTGARFSTGTLSSAPRFPNRADHPIFNSKNPPRKWYTYQPDPTLGDDGGPGDTAEVPFRMNELYLNLTKGPVSVRVGRQTISWGESDTIALLDQSNPFDVTRAVPGLLEDVDEARIPLWTLRTQIRLFDSWKMFSSGFLDTYLVPGSIDTSTGLTPIPAGVSPYSPPESDPQAIVDDLTGALPPDVDAVLNQLLGGISFTQYQREKPRSMANSRYGVRFETIVNRDYTASLWFYRTLSQIPVPHFQRLDLANTVLGNPNLPAGSGPLQLITQTGHDLVNVLGASLSFYSQMLNGVVRLNTQYFMNEPGFVPNINLPFQNLLRHPRLKPLLEAGGATITPGPDDGSVPKAAYLRWEIGFDRFFFNRVLNPSNSFVWVNGLVGSWNVDETLTGRDYRYYGQRKVTGNPNDPWKLGANFEVLGSLADVGDLKTQSKDYVDLHEVEWFIQSNLQTDYFHGRLTPRLTFILNPRGTYVVSPLIAFRFTDTVQFSLKYVAMMGGFFQTGFFRDRDQVAARLTFLLN
jgi:hypothetical protein